MNRVSRLRDFPVETQKFEVFRIRRVVMRRPARLCLWIAATILAVGGARGSSRNSFLANKSTPKVENGEILMLFFKEMVGLIDNNKKWHPRHTTILSSLQRDLIDAAPLCDNYSCFAGENLETFVDTLGFSQETLVVFFNYNMTSRLKGIETCGRCRIFVVARNPMSRKMVSAYYNLQDARKIFSLVFIVVDGPTVRAYEPKSIGNCRIKANLIVKWKPGDVISLSKRYFDKPTNVLRGCTMQVMARNHMPGVRVEDVNGTMTITDGVEGKMLLIVAESLNMNIHVRLVRTNCSSSNTMEQEIVSDTASGKVEIGVGQIRLDGERITRSVEFCNTRRFETVVWCVPRIVSYDASIVNFEFSWTSWILIFIVGAVMICISFVFHRVSQKNLELERKRRNRRDVLITRETLRNRRRLVRRRKPKGWGKMILDVFSMSLGYPVFVDPITSSARILLFTFLYYVIVMTTAYKTSLSAAMTAGIDKPLITDVNGILAANLTTGGSMEELKVLKDQVDASPANRELIRRYVVYEHNYEATNRFISQRNFAFLELQSHLNHAVIGKMKDNVDYYELPDPVLTYSSMIVSEKRSAIRKRLEAYINILFDSGIIDFWHNQVSGTKHRRQISNDVDVDVDDDDGDDDEDDEEEERRRKNENFLKLAPIFAIYSICMLASLLVFMAELIVHKFQ